VLGNIEHVKKTLLTNFMDEIIKSYSKLPLQGYEKDENGKDRLVSYEEKNLRTPIAPYVENLRKQFEKIGEPLPPYINNMATYGDFLNIFTKEDLMMNK
jgi:ribosomal protein S17E